MRIKLKEEPREWRKFTVQVCGVLALGCCLLSWRKVIEFGVLRWLLLLLGFVGSAALAQPRWFRGFYRFGMTTSAWLGEVVGRVFLTVFFFLIILPLGCLLRLARHDPLSLKPRTGSGSYWHTVNKVGKLDRMF